MFYYFYYPIFTNITLTLSRRIATCQCMFEGININLSGHVVQRKNISSRISSNSDMVYRILSSDLFVSQGLMLYLFDISFCSIDTLPLSLQYKHVCFLCLRSGLRLRTNSIPKTFSTKL